MTQIEFYCGTHRSGREAAIDALVSRHWGSALLITSTHGLAGRRMESLLANGALPGGFGKPVCEFTGFAEDLIAAEGKRPRRMGSLDRLLLMRGCLQALAAERAADDAGPDPLAPGWPRHLIDVITQLKQAAVEPDEFAARVKALKNPGPFEALVAGAYARYQAALHDSGTYDVPGLYWEARDICAKGAPRILAGVDLVALDGFDDFTPSQMRLIAALAPRVPRLVIGLNLDMRPDRADLFELPGRTHARLKAVLERQGETVLETHVLETPPPVDWARYAAGRLVPRDRMSAEERDQVLEGLENNVRLIPCLDGQHELEAVAREVKWLIVDEGTAPGRIAVAFREFGSVAGPLREVFQEFRIPYRMRHRTPLRESAVGIFMLRLLEVLNGWTLPAVVDVMVSSWFRPTEAPDPVDAAPMLAREANHVSGCEEWSKGLKWLANRLERRDDAEEDRSGRLPMPNPKEALAALRARSKALETLDKQWKSMGSMPLKAHASILADVIEKCHMEDGIALLTDDGHKRAERDAFLELLGLIETLHDFVWPRTDPEKNPEKTIDRREFVEMLSRAMESKNFTWPDDRNGVWCGEASKLKHEAFDHVYYCGANEGVAPRPPSSSAIYPQTDVERLRDAGVELSGAAEHASMERLLFHHALCAAEKTFTVTWRMQGTDGREALPGAFVAELRDLLGDHTLAPRPRAESLVPATGDAACLRDVANALFLRGDAVPAKAFEVEFSDIAAALAVEKSRHGEADFDAYDGVLADAAAIDWVAGRFGEGHQFSVSQIEKYLGCPFSFFVRHVLGIEDLREPVEELEPLLRGTLFHEAMRLLQESHPRMSATALVAEHGDALAALLDDALRAAFEANAWRTGPVPDALLAAERRRMAKQLLRFMKRAAVVLGDEYKPAHAEAAFGRARGSRGTTLHVPESYVFAHEGVRAQFSGKIDRIDLADGGHARIIDYKTGAVPGNKDIYDGIDLQLTVYQWVVSQLLLPGIVCDEAWYCSLTKNADRDAAGKTATRMKDKWVGREAAARASIVAAVSRIRAGWFPPDPRNPESHDCPDAGRFQKMRIARKRAAMGLAARGGVQGGGEDES